MNKKKSFNFIKTQIFLFILFQSCLPSLAGHESILNKEIIYDADTTYFDKTHKLKNYILDSGDVLNIKFIKTPELNGIHLIDSEGQIFLPRLNYVYVKNLTIEQLELLLKKSYSKYLIDPEIYINLKQFRSVRVVISGAVRNPGNYLFSNNLPIYEQIKSDTDKYSIDYKDINTFSNYSSNNLQSRFLTRVSDLILRSGGLIKESDISNIVINRKIPLGNGGGIEKIKIDLSKKQLSNDLNDLRLYDSDEVYVPFNNSPDSDLIVDSIKRGLSPKFIDVSVMGKVENPGKVLVPLEGSLSDALAITGPRKPLSGKVFLIRYLRNGELSRRYINYSANAKPGSKKNPFLKKDDKIIVTNSLFGRSAGIIRAVTEPFIGIYTTKSVFEDLTN